jgi:hypothetical protein
VLFKGIYEELIIQYEKITLRATNLAKGKYPKGSKVSITIEHYYEFGRWKAPLRNLPKEMD